MTLILKGTLTSLTPAVPESPQPIETVLPDSPQPIKKAGFVGVEMTQFQYESLRDVANSEVNTYMLVKASAALDPPEQYTLWQRNNFETDALIDLGLLTDVSPHFSRQIEENAQMTGRLFRVLKITDAGKLMFKEGHSSVPN